MSVEDQAGELGAEVNRIATKLKTAMARRRSTNPQHMELVVAPGSDEELGAVWADDFGRLTDVSIDPRAAASCYERDVITALIAAINKASVVARAEYKSWVQKEGRFE